MSSLPVRELRGQSTSLPVDVVGERLTPALVLAAAPSRRAGM
ncbi:hypothetical protein ACRYCC_19635 [Actinomadura scrupuli]